MFTDGKIHNKSILLLAMMMNMRLNGPMLSEFDFRNLAREYTLTKARTVIVPATAVQNDAYNGILHDGTTDDDNSKKSKKRKDSDTEAKEFFFGPKK
jgi:hypothetical protein